eukprot:scaffold3108_cov152-Cylindrotheca_fusiformis.AAC.18
METQNSFYQSNDTSTYSTYARFPPGSGPVRMHPPAIWGWARVYCSFYYVATASTDRMMIERTPTNASLQHIENYMSQRQDGKLFVVEAGIEASTSNTI